MANLADQTENLILHRKCLNRQSERNGSGGSLKTNRITCEGYANLTVCVLCLLSVYPSTCVSVTTVIPLIQYPSFPTGFSYILVCFAKIWSTTAEPNRFSLMCVCVFGPRSIGLQSVIYVSHIDAQLGIFGENGRRRRDQRWDLCVCVCVTVRFNDVSQVSVYPGCRGEKPAFLLLYFSSIIAADNELFA